MSYNWCEPFHERLNMGDHVEAKFILDNEMTRIFHETDGALTEEWTSWNAELANLAIVSSDFKLLKRCANFWISNELQLIEHYQANYYFIRANIMAEYCFHQRKAMRGVNLNFIKDFSNNVLKYYWKSWKLSFWKESRLLHEEKEIVINHSNALCKVGRYVEAIQNYDVILNEFPNMPEALLSKADHLRFWYELSLPPITESLFCNILNLYNRFLNNSKTTPPLVVEQGKNGRAKILKFLIGYDVTEENINMKIQESRDSISKLSESRKFAILNFLSLSEHAVYCPCDAATHDDLSIGREGWITHNGKIIDAEGHLNRLKSEFALARKDLFDSFSNSTFPDDVMLTNVIPEEKQGYHIELTRSAFRIAYGVMDKIARALYVFYSQDTVEKDIYFDNVWDKCPALNANVENSGNIHICALYSIALDLRYQVGELVALKEIRNRLEHEFLVLKKFDPLGSSEMTSSELAGYYEMQFGDFQQRTLHLMRLTRAAIFSFAYACRHRNFMPKDDVVATGPERIIDFSKF